MQIYSLFVTVAALALHLAGGVVVRYDIRFSDASKSASVPLAAPLTNWVGIEKGGVIIFEGQVSVRHSTMWCGTHDSVRGSLFSSLASFPFPPPSSVYIIP